MPRPRNSTEMRPSIPAPEALPLFEGGAFFVSVTMGSFLTPALWDGDDLDPDSPAGHEIGLTVETPIGAIPVGSQAEGFAVLPEGRLERCSSLGFPSNT